MVLLATKQAIGISPHLA